MKPANPTATDTRRAPTPDSVRFRRLQVLVMVLGLVATVSAFSLVRNWEQQTAQLRFQTLANANEAILSAQLQSYYLQLGSLQELFAYSEFVSRDEFAGFTQSLLERLPAVESVIWAPRVQQAERELYESGKWLTGIDAITIHATGSAAEAGGADGATTYHPVTYLNARDHAGNTLIGYDLGASPSLSRLLQETGASGRPAFGVDSETMMDSHGVHGYFVQPVKTGAAVTNAATRAATGFVVLRIDLARALRLAAEQLQGSDLVVTIYDDELPQPRRRIYSTLLTGVDPTRASQRVPGGAEPLVYARQFPLLGEHWRIVFTPTASYLDRNLTWHPWIIVLLGLMVTVWVLVLIGYWQRRAARMQLAVDAGVQALEKSRLRQDTILQTVADGIITIDSAGLISSFNRAAEQIFGYDAAEVLGRNVSLLLPVSERQEHENFTANSVLYQPRIINQVRDLVGQRRDGSLFPLELNVTPINTEAGRGFVGVLHDITERKRAEEILREQKERLSDILENTDDAYLQLDNHWRVTFVNARVQALLGVNREQIIDSDLRDAMPDVVSMFYKMLRATLVERRHQHAVAMYGPTMKYLEANSTPTRDGLIVYFRDVTQQKNAEFELISAKETAEKASRAKSQYLSRMSHELRTPMNAVLGFSQLLEMDHDLTEAQRASIDEIMKAGNHLLALIDEVLDLSRIEVGKYDFQYRELRVSSIVQESLALVGDMAARRGIRIENRITAPQDCVLRLDQKALKQILVNLLSNAIKYNVEGGSVTLTCSQSAGHARISVLDTGPGIDAAFHERLFDPFERLGRESEIEGAGIGLSVVKGLVEGMGGRLGVDSQPGQGSTFWVEFELRAADEDRVANA